MADTLFIIGSSDQFIPIIDEAHKMGLKVVCADDNEKGAAKAVADVALQIDISDPDAFSEAVLQTGADGIITAFSDKLLRLYGTVCEKTKRPAYISEANTYAVTHKDTLRKRCEEFGIPQARFTVLESIEEIDKTDLMRFPLVIKPNACYGGREMYIVNDRTELQGVLPAVIAGMSEGKVTVEEYCEGQEIFVTVWIHEGTPRLVFSLDRLMWFGFPGRPGQTYANRIPSTYMYQYEDEILSIAQKTADAFSVLNGPMTMQMLVCKDGVKLIEPLMRLTGGSEQCVAKYLTDFDTEAELIRVAMGWEPNIDNISKLGKKNKKCAFYFPVLPRGGKVGRIEGFDDLLDRFPFVLDVNIHIKEGDVLPSPNDMTQICGRVYGTAETYFELEKNIRKVKEHLSIKDEFGKEMILNRREEARE